MKNLNRLILISLALSTLILSGCTGYKSTWDCPKVKGIGCSSLGIADEVARKQILLNTGAKNKKIILIKHNASKYNSDHSNADNKHDFEEAEIY